MKIDPHWQALIPDATVVKGSLRRVSLVQLGQTESWLWGKDTVFPSMFFTQPTFHQVSQRKPAKLADVRILIEFDKSMDHERSPYFIRFWRSEKQSKWQPLALKLVRTAREDDEKTPQILF